MRSFWLAVLLLSAAQPAIAHSFVGGAGYYDQFTEGAAVILSYPAIFIPLGALALLVSLWDRDGLPRILPTFFASQIVGIFVANFFGELAILFLMTVGVITAALVALQTKLPNTTVFLMTALIGSGALCAALEGHALFELPPFIYVGLFFACSLVVMVCAGLAKVILDKFTFGWARTGLRVVSSWIGAILVFMMAFEISVLVG